MDFVVTNDANVHADDCEVLDFNEFLDIANSDEGLSLSGDLYIDVLSIPSEDMYEALIDVGIEIKWFLIGNSEAPDWFTGSLSKSPVADENEIDADSAAALSESMNFLDLEDSGDFTGKRNTIGRIITFGSAKGGAGKTFTSIITAIYYAKDNPNKKVCLLDLDVEEPQVCAAIRIKEPNVKYFYVDYIKGNTSFEYMKKCRVNTSVNDKNKKTMPPNLDFYLSPRELHPIKDNDFWEQCMSNLFFNYDLVVLDTGTTYMQVPAIASAYRVADKINLVSMANLPSSVAISDQIKRLTGEIPNDVYSKEDELENKINLIITNAYNDTICNTIVNRMGEEAPICAKFGNLTQKINEAQMLGRWDIFDSNNSFREGIRNIYS